MYFTSKTIYYYGHKNFSFFQFHHNCSHPTNTNRMKSKADYLTYEYILAMR